MAITGLNRPDFRTLAEFRKRHLAAMSNQFVQVLRLCRAAGPVGFAHMAFRHQTIIERLTPQSDERRADQDGRAGPGR